MKHLKHACPDHDCITLLTYETPNFKPSYKRMPYHAEIWLKYHSAADIVRRAFSKEIQVK